MGTGWMVRVSNLGRGERFLFCQKRPHRLWGPSSLLIKGLTTHIHLANRLRLSGSIPLLLLQASMAWILTVLSLRTPYSLQGSLMQITCSSESRVPTYQNTCCHNPEVQNMYIIIPSNRIPFLFVNFLC